MTTTTTRAAITAALTNSGPLEVIDGIKSAVIREIEALDPGSIITSTNYFNHTFVPDLVVQWSEGGRPEERPIFLRFTLRAALAGRDVAALSSSRPIVLTLREDANDAASREGIRREVEASPGLLLTEVAALDEAIASTDGSVTSHSPLLDIVKQNIVRGARGMLDTPTMQALNSSASPDITGDSQTRTRALEQFDQMVGSVFIEDAALRIRRSADILRIGLSPDADELLGAELDGDTTGLQGRLSSAEVMALLPYLLSHPGVTTSALFWSQVGAMMDLGRLEEMASRLEGIDLGPLVGQNLDVWEANRAYLAGLAENEVLELGSDQAGWRIRSGLLTLALSNWRLMLAVDGRRLRGRSDSPSARWAELEPALRGFDLTSVKLQGISRTVEIGAADEGDVRQDVEAISESIEDEFFVPLAHVRERDSLNKETISTDFRAMLAIAKNGASLRTLSRTALSLLGYRYPADSSEYSRFLDERPGPQSYTIDGPS